MSDRFTSGTSARGYLQRALLASAALVAVALQIAGCQAIAGIKDRHYEAAEEEDAGGGGGGTGNTLSALCKTYCSDVMANCTEEFTVYPSEDTCLEVCSHMTPGDPKVPNPKGNTVACRAKNAKLAGDTSELDVHCPLAGPGGGAECGSDCESYCKLFNEACPDDAIAEDCVRKCGALENDGTFDVKANHDFDTLQCRLVHVSNAFLAPETHCWHAKLQPSPKEGAKNPCANEPAEAPTCEEYCRVVMVACESEDTAVYEDEEQCLKVCAALEPGTNADTTQDTVGCRRYHSYNSIETPSAHCPHAGPGGDGHCGLTNCPAYCRITKAACGEQYAAAFASDEACEAACADIDGAAKDTGYSVKAAKEGGDNLRCRILFASRALSDPAACDGALGNAPCQ